MKHALAAAAKDPTLGAALSLHRGGKLVEAIHAYRTILEAEPSNVDAAFLCGLAALQAGAFEAAANLFMGACRIDPGRPDIHANLGLAYAQSGTYEAAIAPLVRASLLDPGGASFAFNLGQILDRVGQRGRALAAFRASSLLQPGHGPSWIEFGATARLEKKPAIANRALLMALRVDETAPRAWFNLAMLRADQSLDDDAEMYFRKAVELDPGYAEAIGNLGNHLRSLKRRSEARAVLEDGILRHPLSARLRAGLAAVAFDDDRVETSDLEARRASVLDPTLADAAVNLAQSLHRAGAKSEAVRHGARARLLAPGDDRLLFNQATYLLGDGRLREGWKAYDARLAGIPEPLRLRLPGKRWNGGPPPGRNLWVAAEQGLGDELLFATCFTDLNRVLVDGELDSVTIECDRRLHSLLERTYPSFRLEPRAHRLRIDDPQAGPFGGGLADCHVHAGSLPGLFRKGLSDFPNPVNRLSADPDRVAHWSDFLRARHDGPIYGLTWRSMNRRDRGEVYYPPLHSLAPIMQVPGIRFVSLQYDDPEPDLLEIEKRFGVEIIRPEGLDTMNDLDGIAALLAATDGMVSAYTAALNLAGIIGVNAYTATYGYFWPTLGTGTLPWYPSVRIEMRTGSESWDAAIRRLAKRLAADLKA